MILRWFVYLPFRLSSYSAKTFDIPKKFIKINTSEVVLPYEQNPLVFCTLMALVHTGELSVI